MSMWDLISETSSTHASNKYNDPEKIRQRLPNSKCQPDLKNDFLAYKMFAADQGHIGMHTLPQKKFHMRHPSFCVESSAQAVMKGTEKLQQH